MLKLLILVFYDKVLTKKGEKQKMARSRRNKRVFKRIVEAISWKTFFIVTSILAVIIAACLGSNIYRTSQEKKLLAQQREELDKQIEDIFSDTVQNISDVNSKKRDSIITLSAVGDILCENELIEDAKQGRTYNFNPMFQNITGFLKRSDIVLGTMETNFVDKEYSGFGLRNSPKEFADAVKNSGVNLVSISTNHSLDYGISGLKQTKEYLQDIGYDTVGDNLGDSRVTIKTIKETKEYIQTIKTKHYVSNEQWAAQRKSRNKFKISRILK